MHTIMVPSHQLITKSYLKNPLLVKLKKDMYLFNGVSSNRYCLAVVKGEV
jgi:hypothetical protein